MSSIRERLSGDREYTQGLHNKVCMEWIIEVIKKEEHVEFYFDFPPDVKQKEHIKNLILDCTDRILAKEMYECKSVNVNMIQTFICGIFLVCYKHICGIDWMTSDENKFAKCLWYMIENSCRIKDIVDVELYILEKYDWTPYINKDNQYDSDLRTLFVIDIQEEENKEEKDLMWKRLKEMNKNKCRKL